MSNEGTSCFAFNFFLYKQLSPPRGGGGGYSDIFTHTRLGLFFWGFKSLNFNIIFGCSEK